MAKMTSACMARNKTAASCQTQLVTQVFHQPVYLLGGCVPKDVKVGTNEHHMVRSQLVPKPTQCTPRPDPVRA